MALRYNEEVDKNNTLKLRKMLANLPESCSTFMRGIEQRTESRTRIAYAYDLSVFFTYLRDEVSRFHGKQLTAFTLEDIESITVLEIEKYVDTLKYRVRQNPDGSETELLNSPSGIKRKLSSLKSFYRYLYKDQLIQKILPSLLICRSSVTMTLYALMIMKSPIFSMKLIPEIS